MTTATRRFEINASHRLHEHPGRCRNVHGHRYAFEVTVTADDLGSDGTVIDFSDLKELVGGWLDQNFDHAAIVWEQDVEWLKWLRGNKQHIYVMDDPPTIEHMVRLVFDVTADLLGAHVEGVRVVRVVGYETANCWAEYRG